MRMTKLQGNKVFNIIRRLRKKSIEWIIRFLQPGAEKFSCPNGKLLCVLDSHKYYCNLCLRQAKRSDDWDCYCCLQCNIWLEDNCKDEHCNICIQKINKPKPMHCLDELS